MLLLHILVLLFWLGKAYFDDDSGDITIYNLKALGTSPPYILLSHISTTKHSNAKLHSEQ